MQRQVHIVGTGHHYQLGAGFAFGGFQCTTEDQAAFLSMLRELVQREFLGAVAEELNQQALQEAGGSRSVPQALAAELGLPHLFCEPDRTERTQLGIRDENSIRISAFPKTLDATIVQRLAAESWRLWEEEWLKRLVRLNSSRTLFVCGANHVGPFVARATDHGFQVVVSHANWET